MDGDDEKPAGIAGYDPPRCLHELRVAAVPAPPVDLDTLCERPNDFFALSCPCGGERFTVASWWTEHFWLKNLVAGGPVTVRCERCGRASMIFDLAVHGHDAELGHFPPPAQTPRTDAFACPACQATSFDLVARFEHSPNNGAGEVIASPHGEPIAATDLFTWFSLLGRCGACGAWVTMASVCCA